MQQQQMQALQAQYTGGQGGKWNLGAAYRPPDTNINLSAAYQQGRWLPLDLTWFDLT